MRVWAVTVAKVTHRRLMVPATDEKAAARAVRATLRPGERVEAVVNPDAGGVDGATALVWLFDQPFLPALGKPHALRRWAADARLSETAAPMLALAGLRWVEGQDLFIGSANSVPWLAGRCDGSPLAGHGLTNALGSIPGATRTGARTLAGVPTRGVIVPRRAALDALAIAAEAA